jgi:hypothetical protein
LGIPLLTLYRRLRKYSVENALDLNYPSASRYTHKGQTLTIKEWAKKHGVRTETLRGRIKKGMPFPRVLTPKRLPSKDIFITFQGKTLNMSQWAKKLGLTRERVRQLLLKYPPEIALLPPKKRKRLLNQN